VGTYYNNNGTLEPIAGRGSGVNRNDVAYVETGTTASRNYSIGQLVYVSGAMYRVKSAIQSGQTFTVGTNIEATTIGGEIQRINNDLIYSTNEINTGKVWIDGNSIYRKVITNLALPNNTTQQYDTGLTGNNNVISVSGYMRDTNGNTLSLNWIDAYGFIRTYATRNGAKIGVNTSKNLSTDVGTVILEYTKTT
jgi:hypothetical protein